MTVGQRVSGLGFAGRRARKQIAHFVIGCLREIFIILPDTDERTRRDGANNLINLLGKIVTCGWRTHGNRHDNFGSTSLTQSGDRGAHGCARGQAVIDQNHRSAAYLRGRLSTAIAELAPLQFFALNFRDGVEDQFSIRQRTNDVVVYDSHPARGNRPHGQFLVTGYTQFSDNKNIQRNPNAASDLKGHWHTAAWKSENDDIVATG